MMISTNQILYDALCSLRDTQRDVMIILGTQNAGGK